MKDTLLANGTPMIVTPSGPLQQLLPRRAWRIATGMLMVASILSSVPAGEPAKTVNLNTLDVELNAIIPEIEKQMDLFFHSCNLSEIGRHFGLPGHSPEQDSLPQILEDLAKLKQQTTPQEPLVRRKYHRCKQCVDLLAKVLWGEAADPIGIQPDAELRQLQESGVLELYQRVEDINTVLYKNIFHVPAHKYPAPPEPKNKGTTP
ncbi:MAG: hypothetical protein NZ602_03525 [Thermoguttaceae bacterium]|nr:hypothetical protein [Thermoguttaceae bacterium]MDW8037376.1 hypothetical protein [Thermoguttaceae bacterium]